MSKGSCLDPIEGQFTTLRTRSLYVPPIEYSNTREEVYMFTFHSLCVPLNNLPPLPLFPSTDLFLTSRQKDFSIYAKKPLLDTYTPSNFVPFSIRDSQWSSFFACWKEGLIRQRRNPFFSLSFSPMLAWHLSLFLPSEKYHQTINIIYIYIYIYIYLKRKEKMSIFVWEKRGKGEILTATFLHFDDVHSFFCWLLQIEGKQGIFFPFSFSLFFSSWTWLYRLDMGHCACLLYTQMFAFSREK